MNTNHEPHRAPPGDLEALLGTLPQEEAERLREVWDLAGADEPTAFPLPEPVEAALRRFETRVATPASPRPHATASPPGLRSADRSPRERRRGFGQRRGLRNGLLAGAAVLLVGVIGVFGWMRPVVHTAPVGERVAFTLPDGSSVELNSGSMLRHARRFGEVRAVTLEGEAYFDVQKEQRPFVVETFNARVKVLGTRFGVRAWRSSLDAGTTVALESGRVSLEPAGGPQEAVTMAPGETRRLAANDSASPSYLLASVSVDEATAWRRGDLVYKDQFLGDILEDVARRYAVEMAVHPSSLRQRRLNLALRQPASAEAVANDLAAALGLRYRPTSNGFILSSDAR